MEMPTMKITNLVQGKRCYIIRRTNGNRNPLTKYKVNLPSRTFWRTDINKAQRFCRMHNLYASFVWLQIVPLHWKPVSLEISRYLPERAHLPGLCISTIPTGKSELNRAAVRLRKSNAGEVKCVPLSGSFMQRRVIDIKIETQLQVRKGNGVVREKLRSCETICASCGRCYVDYLRRFAIV